MLLIERILNRDWLQGYFRLYHPERHVQVNLVDHKLHILYRAMRNVAEDGLPLIPIRSMSTRISLKYTKAPQHSNYDVVTK